MFEYNGQEWPPEEGKVYRYQGREVLIGPWGIMLLGVDQRDYFKVTYLPKGFALFLKEVIKEEW